MTDSPPAMLVAIRERLIQGCFGRKMEDPYVEAAALERYCLAAPESAAVTKRAELLFCGIGSRHHLGWVEDVTAAAVIARMGPIIRFIETGEAEPTASGLPE